MLLLILLLLLFLLLLLLLLLFVIYLWGSGFFTSFWRSLTQTPVGRFMFCIHRISEAMLKADKEIKLKGKNG